MKKASGINFMFDEEEGIIKVVHQLFASDDYNEDNKDHYNVTNYLQKN